MSFFFFFLMQMDWLQLEPKRRQVLFCSLMLFQLPVCCTKEAAWWHDECTALFCLCCCLCLSLIKGSGPDDARGERIRLCGLSRETSAEGYSLEGDVLQCGANSPWGGSSIRHNLFIYHMQDLSMPLTSQNIQWQRHKGHAFPEEAVVLLN